VSVLLTSALVTPNTLAQGRHYRETIHKGSWIHVNEKIHIARGKLICIYLVYRSITESIRVSWYPSVSYY